MSLIPYPSLDHAYIGSEELSLAFEADLAVGLFADYRTELLLASQRLEYLNYHKSDTYVIFHSLIDSLIYPTIRFHTLLNSKAPNEDELLRWTLTTHLNGMILKDTFPADAEIFFLKGQDLTEYSARVQEGLEILLTDWNFNFTTWEDHKELTSILYKKIQLAKVAIPTYNPNQQ